MGTTGSVIEYSHSVSFRSPKLHNIMLKSNESDSIPDTFNIPKVTSSHIRAANILARLKSPQQGHNAIGKCVAITHSGGVVEVVAPKRKWGKLLGSIDTRLKEEKSKAQLFVINT
ncbi:hypothetical protein L6452_41528 [Arctium lappa]|uniref:Uncharacterized protein n=1 Tax=Arctium lappa TaxID=4217 RepID=A0ACB8XP38_ARCLA|nr:hypothetical protein L6452_41528 [Arctium lappa]